MSKKEINKATNNKKKKKSKNKISLKIPRTVQQSIPYKSVYTNGVFEIVEGKFSKSYKLDDVNFKKEDEDKQESMILNYETLLNSFDSTMTLEVSIFNRSTDQDTVKNNILIKPKKDDLNLYRDEYNQMLLEKMDQGRNNIVQEKYITVSVEADNIEIANTIFNRIDIEISNNIQKINNHNTSAMTLTERLSVLYDVYGGDADLPFNKKIDAYSNNHIIDMNKVAKLGLSSKDLVGPMALEFFPTYFKVGDKFARTLVLDNYPTFMHCDILPDLANLSTNMITSVFYRSLMPNKAIKLIKNQTVNITGNVIDAEKRASKAGYSADNISPELKRAKTEANALLEEVMSRNQKIFFATVLSTIFADTLDDLDSFTESLKSIAISHLCQMKVLTLQQEVGFNSTLPLGSFQVGMDRILTTESSAVFIPFSTQELMQPTGFFYGLNEVSNNLILYDRSTSVNYNGLILGKPGSGKSFIAKNEIINILLNTDDDVIVIDPQNEYQPLADIFGGEVIRIAVGTNTHINPLDMDVQYAGENEDPIAMKCDFLVSICETIAGGKFGLTPTDISIINRCGRKVYMPYMQHMKDLIEKGITCDKSAMPTLIDFYECLLSQPEPEAQALAIALETYCTGNYDTFAHVTNVDTSSRFLVYNIKDIGTGMKELGHQICLNDGWNRIIENKKRGKRTWLYIDEFHLLMQTESSIAFLQSIYKLARKWNGVPTGITQNVSDLLTSHAAKTIIQNCDFVLMMNQSSMDRAELSEMYNISPALLKYITEQPAGTGLLYNGKTIVPFVNEFPENTELYKAMSTKPVAN